MPENYKRQILFRTNQFQRPIINVVIASALVTIIVITLCISYVYNGMVDEIMNPTTNVPTEELLILIVLMCMPVIFSSIVLWTYRITNEMVGAFERLLRELDQIITSKKKEHLVVRKRDVLAGELIKRINILIDRMA